MTIDPAKRLADALGLEGLSNVATEIDRERWVGTGDGVAPGGRLFALMLDTKSTFDLLVTRHATDQEQVERILNNAFYRNVSGALGGTQEYMAMEKLHELHDEGGFDLIVVDTPPTRHALDFLDAPKRLTRLLDNRVFRVLITPTRATMRVASVAVQTFLRTVARVVGSEVIKDVIAFFRAFEGMEEGFPRRAPRRSTNCSRDPRTAFVLVTSPRRDALEEAMFFADRLATTGQHVDALIVNRVHPAFGDESPGWPARHRRGPAPRPVAGRGSPRGVLRQSRQLSRRRDRSSAATSTGSAARSATTRGGVCAVFRARRSRFRRPARNRAPALRA